MSHPQKQANQPRAGIVCDLLTRPKNKNTRKRSDESQQPTKGDDKQGQIAKLQRTDRHPLQI
ncbi:MAG: hypothetical protein ACO3X1_14925, partial [Burkholderiaceae bacterium]